MNERDENEYQSLDDVLDAGFARVAAEEEAAGDAQAQADADAQVMADEAAAAENAQALGDADAAQVQETVPDAAEQTQIPAQDPQTDMINELRAHNQQLTEQITQLVQSLGQSRQAVQEQSQVAEEAANQAATITLPQLNINELQYMSPDEQAQAQNQYQADMANALREMIRQEMMTEMQPMRDDYEARTREAAVSAAKDQIYNDPRFPDFREHDAEIDSFIGSMPEFSSMEPGRARLLGGLINRGLRTDPNKTMTTDELVSAVMANPDAQKALEIRRAQNIQKQNENLPKMTASQGMTNAAAVPEHRPQTKEELFSNVDKYWGR